MSSRCRPSCGYGKSVAASIVFIELVLFACASQADPLVSTDGEALPDNAYSDPDVSFWVDAAPLDMVIRQLALLSGRTAEIEDTAEAEVANTEKLAEDKVVAESEEAAESEEVGKSMNFSEVLVSGRFSGSLSNTLAQLSADYPVIFDLNGETLSAVDADAQSSVSIAMLSSTFDESFKSELLASSGSGNSVEFREDAVRVSGHPTFVERQAGYITKALATAEARRNAGSLTAKSVPMDATSLADSGSTQVLVDIQDEDKPPAEQANLSEPIRWVTDIPGFHTF